MSANVEAWLEQNTIRCPIGRVTQAQCRQNRARPTIAQWAHGDAHGRPGEITLFRPRECEACREWKELFGGEKLTTETQRAQRAQRKDKRLKARGVALPAPRIVDARALEGARGRDAGAKGAIKEPEVKPLPTPADAAVRPHRRSDANLKRLTSAASVSANPNEVRVQGGATSTTKEPEAILVPVPDKREKEPKDKWGKPIRECLECHEHRGIVGRGLCSKCWWHQPDVKARRDQKRRKDEPAGAAGVVIDQSLPVYNKKGRAILPCPPLEKVAPIIPASSIDKRDGTQTAAIIPPPTAAILAPVVRKKGRKYPDFTPEMDAEIRRVYETEVGMIAPQKGRPVRELAEKFGLPRWKISKRAFRLGVVPVCHIKKKEPVWAKAELALLRKYAALTVEQIQRRLRTAGYSRGLNAIKIKVYRIVGRKPRDGYSSGSLAKRFGIDSHYIERLIKSGLLKAERRGTNRTQEQGGDWWIIQEAAVRDFIIKNPEMVDFRKVDGPWLVDVVAGNSIHHGDTESTENEPLSTQSSGLSARASRAGGGALSEKNREMRRMPAKDEDPRPGIMRPMSLPHIEGREGARIDDGRD